MFSNEFSVAVKVQERRSDRETGSKAQSSRSNRAQSIMGRGPQPL